MNDRILFLELDYRGNTYNVSLCIRMVRGYMSLRRMFMIDADEFSQTDFELIHRYIRKRLDPKNKDLVIRSIDMDYRSPHVISCVGHWCDMDGISLNNKFERLIFRIGDRV